MYRLIYAFCLTLFVLISVASSPLGAGPLDLPQTPLSASTAADPNVMFLFDNSGSMKNVIWAGGYDPTVIYADWNPGSWSSYWNYVGNLPEGSCASGYKEGQNGGTTKCLKLPAPLGDSDTRYYTNYLNYLFATHANNSDLTTGAIPDEARITVAKNVTSALVSNTPGVRFGMMIFNTGNNTGNDEEGTASNANKDHGGELVAACGSDVTTLQNAITAVAPETNTPVAESLYEITRYFRGMKGYYNNNSNYTSPIQYRCQQNHVVVITDGLPTFDSSFPAANDDPDDAAEPSASISDWDNLAPATALPANDADRTNPAHYPPYSDGTGEHESYEGAHLYLDDIAKFGYDIDLRKGGTDLEGQSFDDPKFLKQTMRTSTIGFAAPYQMLKDAAEYGGGHYYPANNASELTQALQAALGNIVSITSSAASVAVNSGQLEANSHLYQTQFFTGEWYGHVLAIPLDATDGSLQAPAWDAQTQLDAQHLDFTSTNDTRVIITYDDSANDASSTAKLFQWSDLSQAMKDLLHLNAAGVPDGEGEDRLNYLRGDKSNEGTGNNYRKREHLLDDIIHSAPYYVGAPPFFDSIGSDYNAFYSTYNARTPIVYVGANDGMLHGFNANNGDEVLAYVPYAVFKNLSQLTSAGYSHRYYVDGAPTVGDAYAQFGASRCGAGPSCWRSILVSGLRRGGQGFFALDVTDPATFNESNAAKLALWEFTDLDDVDADLGYAYSQPSIVKMANNKWAAVFGNGYNSTEADGHASATGNAVLYIAFLDGGLDGVWSVNTDFIKIDTGVGITGSITTPNGLATPAPVDVDGDFTVDYIYAGDLRGNLWKFDVRDANPTTWKTAATLLFTTTVGGNAQPIMVRPEVGVHYVGVHYNEGEGVLVYIGTGKYLETSDNSLTTPTNSMYAIWDKLDGTTVTRGELLQQSVAGIVAGARVMTAETIDWTQDLGWYVDLPDLGERHVSRPVLRNDRLIFTTVIPNSQVCGTGGSGWLMEVDAFTGSRLDFSPFDVNGDEKVDDDDLVTLNISGTDTQMAISGLPSPEGMLATPAILSSGSVERKYSSGSSGGIFRTTEHPGKRSRGRLAWRTLP